jgi:hypothetical protein
MMTKAEVGTLLLLASGLDRFVQVGPVTTDAWMYALSGHDVTLEQAQQACVNHYTGPDGGRPFTVAHVVALVSLDNRTALVAIEADVRSAKARGLIAKTWPARERLPENVARRLYGLRAAEREAAAERSAIDQGPGTPVDVGTVGRSA